MDSIFTLLNNPLTSTMVTVNQMYQFNNLPNALIVSPNSFGKWMTGVEREIMDDILSASKPKWKVGISEFTVYLSISVEEGEANELACLLNNMYAAIEIK